MIAASLVPSALAGITAPHHEGASIGTVDSYFPGQTAAGPVGTEPSGKNALVPLSPGGEFLSTGSKTLGALFFILGVILVTALLLKRAWPQRFGFLAEQRLIQVVETQSLGDKRSLSLVRVGKETLLLASTPAQISLLKSVEDPASQPESARHRNGPEPSREGASFQVLGKWLLGGSFWKKCEKRENSPPTPRNIEAEDSKFSQLLTAELEPVVVKTSDEPSDILSRVSALRRSLRERPD